MTYSGCRQATTLRQLVHPRVQELWIDRNGKGVLDLTSLTVTGYMLEDCANGGEKLKDIMNT